MTLVSILFFFCFCIWGDIFASQYLFQQWTVASHRIFLEVLTDQVSLVGKGMLDNTVRKSAYQVFLDISTLLHHLHQHKEYIVINAIVQLAVLDGFQIESVRLSVILIDSFFKQIEIYRLDLRFL